MSFEFFKIFGKNKESKKKSEIFKHSTTDGKYSILDSNLQLLLSNMQKKAKDGNFKDINLETEFETERFVDESKKTISITIRQKQIEDFVSYIKTNEKYFKYVKNIFENIYKTLLTIQFFLPEGEDKIFVKKQINELSKYKEEEKLEPITKSIRMTTEDIAKRNEKDHAEKSNELFINIIANIDKLSNNIKNYDDLIKKILNNSTILKNSTEWSNIENDIISTFEKCFDAISISIKNNLIDSEIYTNTEYIKVIEKFINIIPKEKQGKFIECLKTIESTSKKQNKISTNSIIKSKNECYKLYFKNKGRKIKIEFCSSESMQDFKNKFSDIKSKIKHNRLNTILLQDKSLLLENKILNITCNGKTYKGKDDVWNIEKNYSNINTSTTYSESYNLSPKSEKTDSKRVEQKTSTDSSISKSNVLTYARKKIGMKIKIKFNDSNSIKKF